MPRLVALLVALMLILACSNADAGIAVTGNAKAEGDSVRVNVAIKGEVGGKSFSHDFAAFVCPVGGEVEHEHKDKLWVFRIHCSASEESVNVGAYARFRPLAKSVSADAEIKVK